LADLIERLKCECDSVKIAPRAIKWVNAGIIHLTTQFLGDTPRRCIDDITQALSDIHERRDRVAFSLQSRTIGAFPNLNRPRVIWIDLSGADLGRLKRTVATITERLIALNCPLDSKPFKPHLTLGRVRRDAPPFSVQPVIEQVLFEPLDIRLTSLTLFRSELTREGPIHTAIQTWRSD